jgi:hypothetical protein
MSATTPEAATPAAEASEVRVSQVSGFAIDFSQFLFVPADRAAAFTLWSELRAATGSAIDQMSGAAWTVHPKDNPGAWLTLREANPARVEHAVARIGHLFQPWTLPGHGSLCDRLDAYFAEAHARKIETSTPRW